MDTTYQAASEKIDYYLQVIVDYAVEFGLQLIGAIIVLIIGFRIIKFIGKTAGKAMGKSKLDESLQTFLRKLIVIALNVILIIIVASMVGIQTASLVAVVGAVSLAIGIALQGSLANFAGGVILLFLKPFKVGDFITSEDGKMGTVMEIQLFYTILKTPTNQRVVVPNGKLSNNAITNYSFFDTRRLDVTFGIGYSDDIDKAKEILRSIAESDPRTLKDPGPMFAVEELGDSSVNIRYRIWVKSADYWDINFEIHEKVKKAFDEAGINIPFPQRDVHLFKNE